MIKFVILLVLLQSIYYTFIQTELMVIRAKGDMTRLDAIAQYIEEYCKNPTKYNPKR